MGGGSGGVPAAGHVGEAERLTAIGGPAWRVEDGGTGGGGFRGGRGGDLKVDESSGFCVALALVNGLCDD